MLLLGGHDGDQVGPQHATVLLRNLPAETLAKVSVAEPLELVPTRLALLHIWARRRRSETAGFGAFQQSVPALITSPPLTVPQAQLTGLAEGPPVGWQTETLSVAAALRARPPVETGIIGAGV